MSVFLMDERLFNSLAFHPLCGQDELAIANRSRNVLKRASSMTCVSGLMRICSFMDVAAFRRANQAGPDVGIFFGKASDVTGLL